MLENTQIGQHHCAGKICKINNGCQATRNKDLMSEKIYEIDINARNNLISQQKLVHPTNI